MTEIFLLEPILVNAHDEPSTKNTVSDALVAITEVLTIESAQLSTAATDGIETTDAPWPQSDVEKIVVSNPAESLATSNTYERNARRREQRRQPDALAKKRAYNKRRDEALERLVRRWIESEREHRDLLLLCLACARDAAEEQLCLDLLDESDAAIENALKIVTRKLLVQEIKTAFVEVARAFRAKATRA